MASILSEAQCKRIRQLNKEFEPYAEQGWMCEGSDSYGPCNCIFNNDTDEVFWADYHGNILEAECLDTTSEEDMENMARIQGAIRKV